jgi:hypothetical protein
MLEKDLDKRLGCEGAGGYPAFKAMPWFADIDWDLLETKGMQPPMVPDVSAHDPRPQCSNILVADETSQFRPFS